MTELRMVRHLADLIDRIDVAEHIRRRVVEDAVADALACTWTRRAALFDWAAPTPEDHPGGPVDWDTGEPLDPPTNTTDTGARIRGTALACRRHAELQTARCLDD